MPSLGLTPVIQGAVANQRKVQLTGTPPPVGGPVPGAVYSTPYTPPATRANPFGPSVSSGSGELSQVPGGGASPYHGGIVLPFPLPGELGSAPHALGPFIFPPANRDFTPQERYHEGYHAQNPLASEAETYRAELGVFPPETYANRDDYGSTAFIAGITPETRLDTYNRTTTLPGPATSEEIVNEVLRQGGGGPTLPTPAPIVPPPVRPPVTYDPILDDPTGTGLGRDVGYQFGDPFAPPPPTVNVSPGDMAWAEMNQDRVNQGLPPLDPQTGAPVGQRPQSPAPTGPGPIDQSAARDDYYNQLLADVFDEGTTGGPADYFGLRRQDAPDRGQALGSRGNPYQTDDPSTVPIGGWYIGTDGVLRQRTEEAQ